MILSLPASVLTALLLSNVVLAQNSTIVTSVDRPQGLIPVTESSQASLDVPTTDNNVATSAAASSYVATTTSTPVAETTPTTSYVDTTTSTSSLATPSSTLVAATTPSTSYVATTSTSVAETTPSTSYVDSSSATSTAVVTSDSRPSPYVPKVESSAASLDAPSTTAEPTTAIPVVASSETSLDSPSSYASSAIVATSQSVVVTPTSTYQATTEPSIGLSAVAKTSQSALVPSSTTETPAPPAYTDTTSSAVAYPETPVVETSEIALSTPDSYTTPSPDSTSASAPAFTYAPETTSTANAGGIIASLLASSTSAASPPITQATAPSYGSDATTASVESTDVPISYSPDTTTSPAESTNVPFSYSPDVSSTADQSSPAFTYVPDTPTDASTVPATAAIGTSTVLVVPIPYSSAEGGTTSAPDAYIIGSQTASVGQTLTIDSTPVVVQTSAGETQLYAGTDVPSAITFAQTYAPESTPVAQSAPELQIGTQTLKTNAPVTIGTSVVSMATDSTGAPVIVAGSSTLAISSYAAVASSAGETVGSLSYAANQPYLTLTAEYNMETTLSHAPTTVTLGLLTVSQESSGGDYLLGSKTLQPGSSVTQGYGSSATVVALSTDSEGSTHLVVAGPSTTAESALPEVTSVEATITSSTAAEESSKIVVNGQTYFLNGATVNAKATGSATTSASSSFITSGASGASASASVSGSASVPPAFAGAATSISVSDALVAAFCVLLGVAALL